MYIQIPDVDLYSIEAEEKILSTLFYDETSHNFLFNILKPDDFYDIKFKRVFEVLIERHKLSKAIDIDLVNEQLKFTTKQKIKLPEYSECNYKELCKVLIKYSKKRQLINAIQECGNLLGDTVDIDVLGEHLLTDIKEIFTRIAQPKLKNIVDEVDNCITKLEATFNNQGLLGLSTSLQPLDLVLNGLNRGRLYILAARPSVGKTALAQQIAEHIALDKAVLYFSLEMSTDEFTQRSLYRRCGYNAENLARGLVPQEQVFEKIYSVVPDLAKLNLSIVDDSKCTLDIIESNIQKVIALKGSCDLVVVDYLQLMQSNNDETNIYLTVTNNSKGLKQLARKYNVPFLVLSQLSRGLEMRQNKRPMLSDLRDSGSIEQDADAVIFIHRDEETNPQNKGTSELIIAKNRQGKRGVIIPVVFNPIKTEFTEYKNSYN